jgi:ligand-binding sensor domain-containing protein
MKKSLLVLVVGLIIMFVCVVCLLGAYQILLELQVRNTAVLGWEDDHYLWTAGMFGNVRWDVNQQAIINRAFRPDLINQFFVSQEGEVWGYGHGVWRFEEGKWIDRGEAAGLPRGVIYDMVQTNDGTIWIATWYGFKTWNIETQLWDSTVIDKPGQTLVQASDNTLWFGLTEDGVIRLQSGELTHWTVFDGLMDNKIRSMLRASDGTIWVGTYRGVNHWDGDSWQGWENLGYPDPEGLVVFKLLETSDGTIWADTSQDFARWKQGQWTTYEGSPFCGESYTFLETDNGDLWAGCAIGLFRWTGINWREYGEAEGMRNSSFSHLIQGSNSILYASNKSGIYQYILEQDYWQPFPNK